MRSLGLAGRDIHARQLRARQDAKIVAVVDPLAERRDQAAAEFGCHTYDSLRKMLRQKDVEVVVIATPSVQHAKDAILNTFIFRLDSPDKILI